MSLNMHSNFTKNYSIFIRILIALFLPLILCFNASESLAQPNLPQTPADAEGPFYPVLRQSDEDNNLIQVTGREKPAQGDILFLSGRVVNPQGQPYENAVVEIWQTDSHGRYKDRRDKSPGDRDPDFQYWGKATCDKDGSYSFTTIVPGKYHPRPAHIHFKVWINGNVRLTSQIYFRTTGSLLNQKLYQGTTPDLQTVDLKKVSDRKYEAFFQIVL